MKDVIVPSTENVLFFYGGMLSQWYPAPMMVDGVLYCTAEQYMMAMKADTFDDQDTKHLIMKTISPREQKALGRLVQGFKPEIWNLVAREVVFDGNMAKFQQNPILKDYLLSTGTQELVEASPTDCVWGIGLGESNPMIQDRKNWRGTNWLGLALMAVRMRLR